MSKSSSSFLFCQFSYISFFSELIYWNHEKPALSRKIRQKYEINQRLTKNWYRIRIWKDRQVSWGKYVKSLHNSAAKKADLILLKQRYTCNQTVFVLLLVQFQYQRKESQQTFPCCKKFYWTLIIAELLLNTFPPI